jgi:hypothetical protein
MNSFAKWRVRNEANILRSEKKRTGNELPPEQVKSGGMLNTGPKQFKGQLEGFKSKLSHKEPQPDGLGDKGMEGVGKATFDREPVKAGQTPTISNGIPVGELKGQFENFKVLKELDMNPAVATGQQDVTAQPAVPQMPGQPGQPEPENPLAVLTPAVERALTVAFDKAASMGQAKFKEFVDALNQKAQQAMQVQLSKGAAGNLGRIQAKSWRGN